MIVPLAEIPYEEIDNVFLDVGGTLASIDFRMVSAKLAELGVTCAAETVEREEAAAKQALSAALSGMSTEGIDGAEVYLSTVLDRLQAGGHVDICGEERQNLIAELAEWLRRRDIAMRIWSHVAPGVPESLATLRANGKKLIAVSNSDGHVAERLQRVGLLDHLDGVVDSAEIGFEKPDPRIFQHAMTQWTCDPARTIHIGDIHAVDVVGAEFAGIHAILIDPFDDWTPPPECHRIPSIPALTKKLVPGTGGQPRTH